MNGRCAVSVAKHCLLLLLPLSSFLQDYTYRIVAIHIALAHFMDTVFLSFLLDFVCSCRLAVKSAMSVSGRSEWLIRKDNNKSSPASACGYAHWPFSWQQQQQLTGLSCSLAKGQANASMQSSSGTNCHYGLTASLNWPIVCFLLLLFLLFLLFFSYAFFVVVFCVFFSCFLLVVFSITGRQLITQLCHCGLGSFDVSGRTSNMWYVLFLLCLLTLSQCELCARWVWVRL